MDTCSHYQFLSVVDDNRNNQDNIMNWNQIMHNSPKAWQKFLNSFKERGLIFRVKNGKVQYSYIKGLNYQDYNIRDLYDFFDYNGLYITPQTHESKKKMWVQILRDYTEGPEYEWCIEFESEKDYRSREEAEVAAFIKAFELLERKMTTKLKPLQRPRR